VSAKWIKSPLFGAVLGAAAGGFLMLLLRLTAQVRTLPERLLEWLLLFVPPGYFEASLLRFGTDAKRYALWATSLGLLVLFTALGTMPLKRRWSAEALLGLGLGLWLLVMLVIMPITSAGVFATELIGGAWNVVLGYLSVFLAYVSGLMAPGVVQCLHARGQRGLDCRSRRLAVLGLGGTVATLVAVYLVPLVGRHTSSMPVMILDPQQPVPSGGVGPPSSHPELAGGNAKLPPAEQATLPAEPTPSIPEPRATRFVKRDQDGAVLPSGRRKGELTDLITSNDDFYIVSKNAGGDPMLRGADWRLLVDGEVEHPIELDYPTLRSLPAIEEVKTLECISNFVAKCELAPFGCDLISTALWRGARLVDILQTAGGVKAGATYLATLSADEYTTVLPIEVALDPATLLVYEMNHEVLPREHGYPARLLVPDKYGMKNAKWLVGLRLTRREIVDWYGQRNWSKDGTVGTMTRIDVPATGLMLAAGQYNVAGIAYAGARGISMVEYSADDGQTWQQADFIEPALGRDAWVRWIGRFGAHSGAPVTLVSRATDGLHVLQPEEFGLPQPDGSSGWHRLELQTRGNA
jgi:DMSO/TMAO reductase YedYZ molybdopterin-dependent catalytic subunit